MQNVKITCLSDAAFRLWVTGLCYCQTALTDGLIPREAVRQMKAPRGVIQELAESKLPGRSPLWEPMDRGFIVHDYLEWNDSRERVLQKRQVGKERLNEWRVKRRTKRVTPSVSNALQTRFEQHSLPGGSGSGTGSFLEKGSGEKPFVSLEPEEIAERAGALVRRYAALFSEHRHGAKYHQRPNLDWSDACELVKLWDDARLEKLAVLVLTTDDVWIAKTDRGFKIFAMKASWADEKLAAWEHETGVRS